MIAIIDYGVGNLFSLASSLKSLGLETKVTRDAAAIRAADHIILPGVGAFADAMAKLEATDYPSDNQPVAMDLLLLSIRNDAQALSGSRNHRISLAADHQVRLKGSEAEPRSAFSNLVFNAVKYSPEESEIRIRWWADAQGAHLSVQDSGIGIDPKHLPRLTERFYRVDKGRSRKLGGTGLGLAIVKNAVILHGGTIFAKNTPGGGLEFIFTLSKE